MKQQTETPTPTPTAGDRERDIWTIDQAELLHAERGCYPHTYDPLLGCCQHGPDAFQHNEYLVRNWERIQEARVSICFVCHQLISPTSASANWREFQQCNLRNAAFDLKLLQSVFGLNVALTSRLHSGCMNRFFELFACTLDKLQRLRQLVRPLIDEVNGGDPGMLALAMLQTVANSHRTLQQAFLGAVKLFLHQYADLDKDRWFDRRNEAAGEWARAVDKIEGSDLRFPLI